MAFDQSTRNRLQRFVTDARRTLEEEFTRQLQNDYGLDPISGTASPLESLRHINDQQRETARILRDTLAHYCASADTDTKAGLDRIVREQAFTVLNRLAALRMAEARGLLMESVGNGYQARGFQLYARLAGTGLGETGDAYRVYLQSVFDELSQDLPGLFDRFSPQGRLFPREAALIQVLTLINHGEIEPLWAEDETIGWIYQYFNSKEERKAMRDASQAPRNSRELAVRNQFFTPRYVVEFLVDNTLGRLWFNWTGGQTGLRDRCQYLLVKPDEQPEPAKRLRDPRTIKLLDPACGSMHFGLYAFDLFLEIYREAWAWEQTHGPGCLDTETGGSADLKPLSQTYADQDAFLHDVPRLVIEHNIYGVDIDPRAAQIASLALWLRAQRAWHEAGVKAKDRPQVGRGHVVAATAPPAEVDLRKRFMEKLDPLDAELFEKTLFLLKGLPELGVLLQVEKELPALVRAVFGEHGDLFRKEDMEHWEKAEARLQVALTEFARAARATYQGRLFAEDALQGLRMIDLCRVKFDAIVMNPPFGAPSVNSKEFIREVYASSQHDLSAVFISRMLELTSRNGLIGVLSNRSIYSLARLKDFRKKTLEENSIVVAGDLGSGVLDAMVEATATVFEKCKSASNTARFIRATGSTNKQAILLEGVKSRSDLQVFEVKPQIFLGSPIAEFSYWVPEGIQKLRADSPKLEDVGIEVRQGIATGDNFRFLRLIWEVPSKTLYENWHPYSKGGEYSPYFYNMHLVVSWGAKWQAFFNGNTTVFSCLVTKNAHKYLDRPALTYPTRTASRFGPRIMPSGMIFDTKGSAIFHPDVVCPTDDSDPLLVLCAVLNSKLSQALIDTYVGGAELASSYSEGTISRLPIDMEKVLPAFEPKLIRELLQEITTLGSYIEPSQYFISPWIEPSKKLSECYENYASLQKHVLSLYNFLEETGKNALKEALQISCADMEFIEHEVSKYGESLPDCLRIPDMKSWHQSLVSYIFGCAFNRWDSSMIYSGHRFPKNIFDPLPRTAPGEASIQSRLELNQKGILASDASQGQSVQHVTDSVIQSIWGEHSDTVHGEFARKLGVSSVAEYIEKSFFSYHLAAYSKSRRQAPIYWPLSTSSGSYTLWLYYPSLTDQTLFTAVNDFIEPKLKQVGQDVAALRTKASARSSDDEKTFEAVQALELELIELRDTLLAIVQTYRPNHDDGVQITAAPLWQLFRHKPWQKILKDTWAKLEKGDYDWAHLAMAYWPDRVREKCETDKSLAIAHDLEHLYVEPDPKPTKARGRKKNG